MAKLKKAAPLLLTIIIILAISLVILANNYFSITDFTVVATVAEMDISAGELQNQMLRDKSDVINYYTDKYNATINKNFWNTEFDGQTPMQRLRDNALVEVKQYKLIQKLALEYDLINDASYKEFLNQMENENQQRKKKIAAGQVVYGAKRYTINSYYDYTLSNMIIDLKYKMSEKNEPLYADDNKLLEFYNEVKDSSYKKIDNYTLKAFSLKFKSDTEQSNYTKDEALEIMTQVENLIKNSNNYIDKITKDYPQVEILDLNLNHDNASNASKTNKIMYNKALTLKTGDVTAAFEENSNYKVMTCITVTDAGYIDFNEIKDSVVSQYNDKFFIEHVNNLNSQQVVSKLKKYDKVIIR